MKKQNAIVRNIPNFITCMNILCGCIAVVHAFNGSLYMASWFIAFAAVFDFLDGFAARLLKSYSELGKQLDSLADMISFGFAPSVIMFMLLKESFPADTQQLNLPGYYIEYLPYLAFLIAIFSAIRLAKFNIDTRQTESFIGLATPANSIFIASFPLILNYSDFNFAHELIMNQFFLVPVILFFSFMLLAEFPMFSFKFKNLRFADNVIRYVFLLITVLLLVSLRYLGIPLIIVTYIILSAINNLITKKEI